LLIHLSLENNPPFCIFQQDRYIQIDMIFSKSAVNIDDFLSLILLTTLTEVQRIRFSIGCVEYSSSLTLFRLKRGKVGKVDPQSRIIVLHIKSLLISVAG